MNTIIKEGKLDPELSEKILNALNKAAVLATGHNGYAEAPVSFTMEDKGNLVGAAVVEIIWGQLHIKYLFVDEAYRKLGIAKKLMEHAFRFGRKRNCQFTFVETWSYQAFDFYKKLGFELEFTRAGFELESSIHYLRKYL